VELKRRGLPKGTKLIEIGAQQLSESLFQSTECLQELGDLYGAKIDDIGTPTSDFRSAPRSSRFWRALGFDYSAIDLDGSPEALAIDLNAEAVPEQMRGAFDFIVNTGTTEHVANQENAFLVIHDLAKVGAVMHHEVPGGGMELSHGFFSYTPKFFLRLADVNRYEIVFFKVRCASSSQVASWVHSINRDKGGTDYMNIDSVQDISLRITLRKRTDQPFVTPLDIPMNRLAVATANPRRAIRKLARGW
jgi:hypothetical protein